MGFQVIAGVKNDQQPDDQDQQSEQQGQPVQTKTEGEAERGEPFVAVQHNAAVSKGFPMGEKGSECDQRGYRRCNGNRRSAALGEQRCG